MHLLCKKIIPSFFGIFHKCDKIDVVHKHKPYHGNNLRQCTMSFDSRSAFKTSGIRLGTPAITTRGAKEDLMDEIAEMIETVLNAPTDENVINTVRRRVNETMEAYPLFAW